MNIDFNWHVILPEAIIATGIIFLTVLGLFLKPGFRKQYFPAFSVLVLILTGASLFLDPYSGQAFHGLILRSQYSDLFELLLIIIGVLTILISVRYLSLRGINYFEYYLLLLVSVFGGMLALSSTNFLTLLVGIETMSLGSYMICAVYRNNKESVEAAFKYFILGAFSTALLLFGIALIYGVTGSLAIDSLLPSRGNLFSTEIYFFLLGCLFLIAGFGFKLAIVPFHFWAADVYRGAPTPATTFLMIAPKVVLFSVLYIMLGNIGEFFVAVSSVVLFLSILSMLVGNGMAFLQKDIKRFLTFSGIAHSGYLLLLLVSQDVLGRAVLAYYLAAYLLAIFGIFIFILKFWPKQNNVLLVEIEGIFWRNPKSSLVFCFFLLTLAGIPFNAGFLAKLYLLYQVGQFGGILYLLLIIINSIVASIYYLKIVVKCFKKDNNNQIEIAEEPLLVGNKWIDLVYSFVFLLSLGLIWFGPDWLA